MLTFHYVCPYWSYFDITLGILSFNALSNNCKEKKKQHMYIASPVTVKNKMGYLDRQVESGVCSLCSESMVARF